MVTLDQVSLPIWGAFFVPLTLKGERKVVSEAEWIKIWNMKYEIWVRTKKLYVISFRFYVSKKSSNRAKRQGSCKSLEGQCWKLTAAGWETPHKPTTGQAPNWDARQWTKVDWQPTKMPTENWLRHSRNRKQPSTERANWQTRTGDNTKLLLHNLFFISSSSGGCEKK